MIRGQRYWLWRGVDNEGEVLDFLVQSKRNAKAALKLMRKLLKKQGWPPTRITTDKLRSYHVAIRTLGLTAQHIDDRRANNRAENSHQPVRRRERKQQRFKSPGSAQRFLNIQSAVYNTSTRTPMKSTKKRSMSWVIRWKREARRALPGREASRATLEVESKLDGASGQGRQIAPLLPVEAVVERISLENLALLLRVAGEGPTRIGIQNLDLNASLVSRRGRVHPQVLA